MEKKPLVVLLGPTAVGKTELAITIAENIDGEIVSADSRLFYCGMDIGTAKPTKEEQQRVKHHLIDVSDPDDNWSLARYQRTASEIINNIQSRHRIPLLVGGTGQYIHAIIEGWDVPKVKPNPILRDALENWAKEIGKQKLHKNLSHLDPEAGKNIDPDNVRRTIRALEVIFSSGKRFSEQKKRTAPLYQTLMIGLNRPRNELYDRVDARIENMIRNGLIEEVERLLGQGYSPELPTLTAIGYREIIAYLDNKMSLDDAIAQIKRKTRIFIRRQANWFKTSDTNINWFRANGETAKEIVEFISHWLQSISQPENE